MVDAPALGAGGVTRGGSSPLPGTKMFSKKLFRYLPIETWIFGIPSLVLFFLTIKYSNIQDATNSFFQNLTLYFFGNKFIFRGLILIYFYVFLRLFYTLFYKIKNKESVKNIIDECVLVFRSLFFWIILISTATYTFANSLSVLFQKSSLTRIAQASQKILSLDIYIFKAYPSNSINVFFDKHVLFGKISLMAYTSATFVIPTTLIFLICTNPKLFRKFLISFFITGYIGLFIWYFIPATSARGYIDINITHSNTSYTATYKGTPAQVSIPYIQELDKVWIDPTGASSNVSTFPSMHASWAILVVLCTATILPILATILAPWFIALSIGAIAVYQHYAVDMVSGTILGILIFFVSEILLIYESKYFTDKYNLMYILNIFKEDINKLRSKKIQ